MKRRRFAVLTAFTLLAPRAAFGQTKPHRIGFLGAESASGYRANVQAFLAGLRDLGYVEGRNISVEYRWAESRYARLPGLAEELVRLNVDVIVTHGVPGTSAAKRATRSIPIVMASAGDAAVTGLVRNLARPEGNVTGSTFFAPEVGAKRLDILKEAMPRLARAAWLFVPGNPITERVRESIEGAAKALHVDLQPLGVQDAGQLEAAFSGFGKQRVEAIVVPEYSLFRAQVGTICRLAAAHRLPSIGFSEFADAGGFMGYGADDAALYRRSALFVDKILKGAKPGDLPVERAAVFQLVVNRQTAKRLGLVLPAAFLARADRVIE